MLTRVNSSNTSFSERTCSQGGEHVLLSSARNHGGLSRWRWLRFDLLRIKGSGVNRVLDPTGADLSLLLCSVSRPMSRPSHLLGFTSRSKHHAGAQHCRALKCADNKDARLIITGCFVCEPNKHFCEWLIAMSGVKVSQAPLYTNNPSGSPAVLDAICSQVAEIGGWIQQRHKKIK